MGNTEETFDELWNRNKALEREISMFEDEYAFVLEQAKLYAMQSYAREVERDGVDEDRFASSAPDNISDIAELFTGIMQLDNRPLVDRDVVREQIIAMNTELGSRYEEQISVCNKLVECYEREKFSMDWNDRNINIEKFPEYIEVVEKLRNAHANSTKQTLKMLDEDSA